MPNTAPSPCASAGCFYIIDICGYEYVKIALPLPASFVPSATILTAVGAWRSHAS